MSKPPLPDGRTPSPRHKARGKRDRKPSERDPKLGGVPDKTLKELMRGYDFSGMSNLVKEFSQTSDRSSAILLSAFVERMLELNITLRLPRRDESTLDRLNGRDGPLNSLYSTTQLAYAMGIISTNIRDELDTVRKIRNVFAHSAMNIDFATPAIISECKKLRRLSDIVQIDNKFSEDETVKSFLTLSEPRAQYSIACLLIWVYLFARLVPDNYFENSALSDDFKYMFKHLKEKLNIPNSGRLALP